MALSVLLLPLAACQFLLRVLPDATSCAGGALVDAIGGAVARFMWHSTVPFAGG